MGIHLAKELHAMSETRPKDLRNYFQAALEPQSQAEVDESK